MKPRHKILSLTSSNQMFPLKHPPYRKSEVTDSNKSTRTTSTLHHFETQWLETLELCLLLCDRASDKLFPRRTLSPSRLGRHQTSCINYSYAELPHCLARDAAVLKFLLFIVGVHSRVVEMSTAWKKGWVGYVFRREFPYLLWMGPGPGRHRASPWKPVSK